MLQGESVAFTHPIPPKKDEKQNKNTTTKTETDNSGKLYKASN